MEILIILGVIIAIILVASIKIVNQAEVYVIERLGKFSRVARPGLTIIIPVIDKVRAVVSLKKQIMDIKPQEVNSRQCIYSYRYSCFLSNSRSCNGNI